MDNPQEAADMSDTLQQISLNQDAALVNIPLEIRRSIYQYFLKVEKTAKMDADNDPAHLDLTLLHLCRQLRSEAVEYLAEKNIWTRLSVFSSHDVNLRDPLWKAPQIPVDLLLQPQREILLSGAALTVTLGKKPRIKDGSKKKKSKKDILFCYTIPSYVVVCNALVTARSELNVPLSITLAAKFTHRNHTIIEDLILPFSVARDNVATSMIKITGISSQKLETAITLMLNSDNQSARDYQHHILALKEEGNKLFKEGHHMVAQLYYANALALPSRFSARHGLLKQQPTQADINVIFSLHTDVANNYVHCVNTNLTGIRNANLGVLPETLIRQVTSTMSTSTRAISWPGISRQQRQRAYHRRMVLTQILAEYCTKPAHVMYIRFNSDPHIASLPVLDPQVLFELATRECFLAWQADIHSQSAPFLKDLYHQMCQKHSCYLSEDPLMLTIRDIPGYEDGVWTGDPIIADGKTEQQLRHDFTLCAPRYSDFIKKDKLRQMKQDAGIPGDRLDGFIQLLGSEYWRPSSTSTNMETKN